MAQAPVNPPSYKTDSAYYWDLVTFLVEDTLFRVPKYNFLSQSQSFAGEYGIHKDGINTSQLVSLTSHIPVDLIKLDVAAEDFRPFLKVLYPMSPSPRFEVEVIGGKKSAPVQIEPSLSEAEWLSVLKLATQWRFNDLRSMAIGALSATKMNEVTKARLAKEYDVEEWLMSAYQALIQRSETISTDEAEKLGWREAIILFQIREASSKASPRWYSTVLCQKIRVAFPTEFTRVQNAQPQDGVTFTSGIAKSCQGVTGPVGHHIQPPVFLQSLQASTAARQSKAQFFRSHSRTSNS